MALLKSLWFTFCLLMVVSGTPVRAECVMLLDFPNESAVLTGPVRAILNQTISIYPRSKLSVTGYADLVANPAGNQVLASARALAVARYATGIGAQPSQISLMPRRGLPELGGAVPSRRLVQLRVTPCDPIRLQNGAVTAGAVGGLGGGIGGGMVSLLLAVLAAGAGGGGSETGTTTTTTTSTQ